MGNVIKQINVANHGLYPFSSKLKERYNFIDYYDINLPCFFWGVIGEVKKINDHKGLKIVKFLTPLDCTYLKFLNITDNLFIINDPLLDHSLDFKFVSLEFEYKDYSIFKPKKLENKIYCYMRDPVEFKLNVLNNIQRKINYEIIFGGLVRDATYYDSLEFLKENYYDKCFLSINLSSKHGYTTVRELGLMGIKTVMYSPYNFPSIIQLKNTSENINNMIFDEDEIIYHINYESVKIGLVQESMDPHNIKNEWLNINFWLNDEYKKYIS